MRRGFMNVLTPSGRSVLLVALTLSLCVAPQVKAASSMEKLEFMEAHADREIVKCASLASLHYRSIRSSFRNRYADPAPEVTGLRDLFLLMDLNRISPDCHRRFDAERLLRSLGPEGVAFERGEKGLKLTTRGHTTLMRYARENLARVTNELEQQEEWSMRLAESLGIENPRLLLLPGLFRQELRLIGNGYLKRMSASDLVDGKRVSEVIAEAIQKEFPNAKMGDLDNTLTDEQKAFVREYTMLLGFIPEI